MPLLPRLSEMFAAFLPQRGPTFFDLFDELAAHAVSTAQRLNRLAAGFPANQSELRLIHDEETQADAVNHRIFCQLQGTFLPPIDPADVHALSEALDSIVDQVDEVTKQLDVCCVASVEPAFVRQTDLLVRSAETVQRAVRCLRKTHAYADLLPLLDEIDQLEEQADDVHGEALAKLFDGSCAALSVLKWKALYDRAEAAVNACRKAGHTLRRISFNHE